MKVAYIAHPVSGDVKGNIKRITAIIRSINLNEPDTVPFCPYYSDLFALDDNEPKERERGIKNDHELFSRGFIDEVRLYGNRLSAGMIAEVELAAKYDIAVVPMEKGAEKGLNAFLKPKEA